MPFRTEPVSGEDFLKKHQDQQLPRLLVFTFLLKTKSNTKARQEKKNRKSQVTNSKNSKDKKTNKSRQSGVKAKKIKKIDK